jgi:CRP/FNR family transcriptional regulator, nitrogen oxide reductase regulator
LRHNARVNGRHDEFLRGCEFFRGLRETTLARLCREYAVCPADEGSPFFRQGDAASRLLLLVEGRVRISQVTVDGQQVTMRIIVPGSIFGAMAFVDPRDGYPASAQAMDSCAALAWKADLFRELALHDPRIGVKMAEVMYRHVEEIQKRLMELATERVQRRIARTLLRLAQQAGKNGSDGLLIDLPLSRQEIAEMTGTTLYTVSRVLRQWEREGVIRAGRERVVIGDAHALAVVADDLAG